MKYDGGGGDAGILIILFILLVVGAFVCMASIGAQSGLSIPTPEPIWPPHNAF